MFEGDGLIEDVELDDTLLTRATTFNFPGS